MLLINLESRIKNKAFWVSLIGAIVLLTQQCGLDATRFIPKNYVDIINSIFAILTILGIIVDPTTPGISDKNQPVEESTSDNAEPVKDNSIDTTAILKENEDLKATLNQIQTVASNVAAQDNNVQA